MEVLAIAIQRGGTGKTTTAAALVQAAAADGQRVLAIDLDPQGNFSFALGANMDGRSCSSYDLMDGKPAGRIQRTPCGADIIPASWNLATLTTGKGSANRLRKAIAPLREKYDLIIIDTPPTAGELQYNALQAATGLIIPLAADIFGLQGLYQIADTAEQFKRSNPDLQIKGIVLTRHNARSTLARQMQQNITDAAEAMGIPFLMAIRDGVAIREAQTLQQSVFDYAPKSKPAEDYKALYEKLKGADT